jgi:riboflavin kinase/FMN adenylyltransferase
VPGVDALRPDDGPLFAVVGVFDGIHLGHLYLLDHLAAEAAQRGARPTVVTFDSHPDEIIAGAAPPLLVDPAERIRLLEADGVEVVVVQHFDAALRGTEYDDFVHRITDRTTLAGLLMTPDAAFGHDRRGTPPALTELGARDGFDVVVVPPFRMDGDKVSSTAIRALIAAGDLAAAARLLGRPYDVVGVPVAEAGPGTLGFPIPVALPPSGTYRVRVETASPGGASDAFALVERDDCRVILAGGAVGTRPDRHRVTFVERE